MDRKAFFDAARELLGGRISQAQVNKFNELLDEYQGNGMKASTVGINLITSFEDLRLNAYDDSVGVWTIGYGTTVYPDGVKVKKGDVCTLDQAKAYFAHDLNRFETAVNSALTVVMNQNQFDALVSLAYNIGEKAFKTSTLVELLNANKFTAAADQFLVWNKGDGKVMKGLVRRRAAERELFLKK
ncbi:lysozyme [Acinetobacter colistiniresistens]|uniref:Lysozyme n=1 Tax=Acinetobacter colistiniresistens TaxID=280145 RepID=S3TV80_9GAMM|nr:lysozyme [Acinetobacter colistiniresistens]EPG39520.1 lysozyme [Acinetobacter colistiniresistens]